MADTLADGRSLRLLNVVDDFTRECPGDRGRPIAAWRARHARPGAPAGDRRPTQDDHRGQRSRIRRPWLDAWALPTVELRFIRPGKPIENAYVESFNGKCRDECLNEHWFASLEDAQQKIDAFRWDYNEHHPHRSLKGQSPREFAKRMLATAAGSLS